MSNSSSSTGGSGGMGVCTILFLIFLVLKLTHNIDWSWWWVFSPIWIPLAILLFFGACIGIGAAIYYVFKRALK